MQIGSPWEDLEKCAEFICLPNGNGTTSVAGMHISCPTLSVPQCLPCYKVEYGTENCCPVATCVPDDVCCLEGPSIKIVSDECLFVFFTLLL